MSSREPMWYCHECNAEMRPLMMPDPHCASCNGTFVEKMENPADDPREFHQGFPGGFQDDMYPPGIESFLLGLHTLAENSSSTRPTGTGRGIRVDIDRPNSPTRLPRRSWIIGGPNTLNPRPGVSEGNDSSGPSSPRTMSEFIRRGPDARAQPGITGPMMAQYLMALLGQRMNGGVRGGPDPFGALFGMPMGEDGPGANGRWGDYVFGQEALDQIITQLMENSNAHRPVPATEEIIEKLPREVLEIGSPLLERDCAVCKEQFTLTSENPDDQIVITLPCKHPFHRDCILPWLKSSGTCPVCRHALVPQPDQHSTIPRPASDNSSRPGSPPSPSRPRSPLNRMSGSSNPNRLLNTLFGIAGNNSGSSSSNNSNSNRRNSDPRSRGGGNSGGGGFPGAWGEELD